MANKIDRRKFLKRMAQFAMASALPSQYLLEQVRASTASGRKRRHFINLIGYGGWDASWHHCTFSGQHLIEAADAHFSLSPGGFEYEHREKRYQYTSKCSDVQEHELLRHPSGVARLGPAMAAAMGGSNWDKTLIWKGLEHPGNHKLNNQMLIHGNVSSYAISSSGLIAAALAQVDRRPLHYVLMADDPVTLFTNFAMAEDAAVPVCLNGISEFRSLTSIQGDDELSTPEMRDEVIQSVRKLSLEVLGQRAKLASSQTVARAYAASIEGASMIYGTNLANDPEMKYLQKYYFLEALKALKALWEGNANIRWRAEQVHEAVYRKKYAETIANLVRVSGGYTALPAYELFLANRSSYSGRESVLIDIETGPTGLDQKAALLLDELRQQTSYFAFADYLIRKNLSAVVDLPAWIGEMDAHGTTVGSYFDELINLQFTFGCFFALQRNLQSVLLPEGGTLLDATMIALHTDFDRYHFHEAKTYAERNSQVAIGTNHANTASVLLAGYGIQGGRVVGGVHEGPNMPQYGERKYLDPLPINASGSPDPNGRVQSILAVAPTLVSAFGTALPAQQVTDYGVVAAVVRKE